MFWAAFGHGARTDLVIMDGDPDAARGGVSSRIYRDVLEDNLPVIIEADSIFMHDNAPIHTAGIIKKFLREWAIDVMDWPAYSPDLIPIENLWFLLKEAIYKKHPELLDMGQDDTAINALIAAAKETWDELSTKLLDGLRE